MRLLPLAALRLMPEAITYAPGESLSSPSWGRVRCQARLLSVEEVLWWRLKGREERLALRPGRAHRLRALGDSACQAGGV